MSEANKAVIRSFVEFVNANNWDRLRNLLAPNFIRYSSAGGEPEVRSAEDLIARLKNEGPHISGRGGNSAGPHCRRRTGGSTLSLSRHCNFTPGREKGILPGQTTIDKFIPLQ